MALRLTLPAGPGGRLVSQQPCSAFPNRYKSSGQEFDKSKGAQFADAEESLITAEAQAELYRKRFEAACSTVGLLKSR